MARRKQKVSLQQLELVVLNRTQVGRARHFINVLGTIARRMRSPLASIRWELAKRRVPQKGNVRETGDVYQESAVALAGY